jgi:ribosomal protein S18 acetylase RimI-like enzyme
MGTRRVSAGNILTMDVEVRILRAGEEAVLARVAAGVFDHEIDKELTREFLADGRHHLAVAVENGVVVGMASAVHYVHPDKRAELWINEVGVAATHRRRGVGKALMAAILEAGRGAGCGEAWVLTDRSNAAAMRLYAGMGGEQAAREQVMFTFRTNGEKA